MPLPMDGSIQVAPSTVARSVEARSRRQPIPADFSPLRYWSRTMAVHRRGRKKPIALLFIPSAGEPASLPLLEKGRGGVRLPSPQPLGQGASRDPQGAVRQADGLSGRKGGRGESTGPATPGEPRPPLPSKGIPRDKRG